MKQPIKKSINHIEKIENLNKIDKKIIKENNEEENINDI